MDGQQSCTAEEYLRSRTDVSIHCLSRGQSIGLTVVVESGLISFIAVLYVFGIIIRNVFKRVRRQRKWLIFEDPIDIIMFSLFLGDAIQALGGVVNARWIAQGKVEVGSYCTSQGVIQQLGETTVAMSTLLIAIYTFRGLWLGKTVESLRATKLVTCGIWLFVTLMIILGTTLNMNKDTQRRYMTPTPYWCWIGDNYLHWRIWGEYVWFWITLAVSFITYVPLFFWSRGNITLDENAWWKFKIHRANEVGIPVELRSQSLIMLAYPVVYCISILPLSVARWIGFIQERNGGQMSISSAATFACVSIHVLSGAFNVLLLLKTRPNTVLFGKNDDEDLSPAPLPEIKRDVEQPGEHNNDARAGPSTLHALERTDTLEKYEGGDLGRLPSR